MDVFTEERLCKYCSQKLEICFDEGLKCSLCKDHVHLRCLKRGSVPGGLNGDVYYTLICQECSKEGNEIFTRNKISWLQVINLVLYHLQTRSPGLARKGFFHWRHHIATFVDKNWDLIFPTEVKRKKKWMGTIAGTLSHFSGYIFLSGTSIFNEPAWWTLVHPKLTPWTISSIYSILLLEKQAMKINKEKHLPDAEMYESIMRNCIQDDELLQTFAAGKTVTSTASNLMDECSAETGVLFGVADDTKKAQHPQRYQKNIGLIKKSALMTIGSPSKYLKMAASTAALSDDFTVNFNVSDVQEKPVAPIKPVKEEDQKPQMILFNPFCHYNTSLNNIARLKGLSLLAKLTGGLREDLILSPYSQIYLKPYIRRDVETFPTWLKLMAELQIVANHKDEGYVLPSRAPIDYTYVQPEHIPAINSICNQFFWPGIDLTEALQYPDYSCVVLYKRLIIGFAFLVPDVKHTENYLSFIFTRPFWRNCGIAKFMLYHLIQTSLGKDITLHVSINNSALFLYQKFGFKVENVVLDFYDKYFRSDVNESKHAFFCRLER